MRQFAIGPGWVWSAVAVALLVAFVYVPAHRGGDGALDGLIATVAGLYVVGLSVVIVRLSRGGILRRAGSTDPIVILGSGPDSAADARISPRWRLAAIAAGTLQAALAGGAWAWLGSQVEVSTYAHSLATLGLEANLALAAGIVVAAPGYAGWALVLALVDAAGTPVNRRVPRAARLARLAGVPIAALLGVAAIAVGDPVLVVVAAMLMMFTASQSNLAVRRDSLARFLAGRAAGDVARPVASHAEADDPVAELLARLTAPTAVTVVERSGALIGAVGPKQLVARDRKLVGQPVVELMVALSRVPLLAASTPAGEVLAALGPHGFALVRTGDGLAYIEATDLLAQVEAGVTRPSAAPDRRRTGRSGALNEREGADDQRH
ncbi:MAG TPA: hypothetical protein VF494_04500 [Candidatus Limnocylindrales bacterium]